MSKMTFLKTLSRKLGRRLGMTEKRDCRSSRLIAVIECILNQNARDAGAATFPAINREIVYLCNRYNVGLLQMPCPETGFLGFHRKRQPGKSIKEALDTDEGRKYCREISAGVADRMENYLDQGCQLIAILGGNPKSPGCAVHSDEKGLLPAAGVFMRELQGELRNRGIEIPFRGVCDYNSGMLAQDIEWLEKVFSKGIKWRRPPGEPINRKTHPS
jgi:predicted secreted protein